MYDESETEFDDVIGALSVKERRIIVQEMLDSDKTVFSFDELADTINENIDSEISEERQENKLHHSYLPGLEDVGLVVYDSSSGEVHYNEQAVEEIEPMVSTIGVYEEGF